MNRNMIMLTTLIPFITYGKSSVASEITNNQTKQPNVIFILADDLGLGDLGCYGGRLIKTPAIDSLSKSGITFSQHYSGSTVSAPSRGSLLTGKHIGHAFIRGNGGRMFDDGNFYDESLPDAEITLGEIFKKAGYATACIGKWGLGGPATEGAPANQGFDTFFGYLSQRNAHRYYPQFLWDNTEKVVLDKKVYSHDLVMEKALDFVKDNNDNPFFLYLTPTIPHADLIVPEGELGEYENQFCEKPYREGGYVDCEKPRATFAAMVSRLDRDVARLVNLLEELGIDENTMIVFTSDNGTHSEGGHDPFFFASSGGFRGQKRDLYEGGIRTPFIVSWKGVVTPGRVSTHVSAFWDFMPTVCELIGVDTPEECDGISYLPELKNQSTQKTHPYLYFEFHEQGGKQAVIEGEWKLIRLNAQTPEKIVYELYNLSHDPTERRNMASQELTRVNNMIKIMDNARTENPIWSF